MGIVLWQQHAWYSKWIHVKMRVVDKCQAFEHAKPSGRFWKDEQNKIETNVIICRVLGRVFKQSLKLLILQYAILVIRLFLEYEMGVWTRVFSTSLPLCNWSWRRTRGSQISLPVINMKWGSLYVALHKREDNVGCWKTLIYDQNNKALKFAGVH